MLGHDPYDVDLLFNNGLGRCDCIDWQTKRHPRQRSGFTDPAHCYCCHIRTAHWFKIEDEKQKALAARRAWRKAHGVSVAQSKEWEGEG